MRLLATVATSSCIVAVGVAYYVYSFKMPGLHPVKISAGGEIIHGRRRWFIASLDEVVLTGHVIVLRGKNGRNLGEIQDSQVGDLESFVLALKRQAPHVVVKADLTSLPPRQVRIPKV